MSLIHTISTTSGFISRYMQHLSHCETQLEAYETTENEHLTLFNRRKYSNYHSFRQVKNRIKKIN